MAGTLVIQPLPGIGDMVWHLPHLEAIARVCPEGSVSVLTKRRSRADELFDGVPYVGDVIWLDRSQSGEPAGRHDGPLGAWRLAGDLRRRGFDTVWILHDSPRYALAARLAGIPLRIGFGIGGQRRFLSDRKTLGPADRHRPTLEKATRLLALHGLQAHARPRFQATPAALERIMVVYGDGRRPWVGLGIGASETFKQWGAERFSALASGLAARTGATVFAIGGPAEAGIVDSMRNTGVPVVPVLGLPLGDVAALTQSCDLVIGNDTGLLNLAASTGAPAIGLFGGSPPLTQYPNLVAIEPPGGATYRVDRMSEIAVGAVIDAASASLKPRTVATLGNN